MNVKELIEKLNTCSQTATVDVIAHNQSHVFSICVGGGGDGTSAWADSQEVSFYVDDLCQSESGPSLPPPVDLNTKPGLTSQVGIVTEDGEIPHVDAPNLFATPVEVRTTQYTNPITRARIRAGLSVDKVAEALGMTAQSYQNRVEVEGRFFKPSTVGRILKTIKTLAQEA